MHRHLSSFRPGQAIRATGLALVLALSGAACSNNEPSDAPPTVDAPATVDPQEPAPPPPAESTPHDDPREEFPELFADADDAAFLAGARELDPALAAISDDDLLRLGALFCVTLHEGGSREEGIAAVQAALSDVEGTISGLGLISIVGNAANELCPQYSDTFGGP